MTRFTTPPTTNVRKQAAAPVLARAGGSADQAARARQKARGISTTTSSQVKKGAARRINQPKAKGFVRTLARGSSNALPGEKHGMIQLAGRNRFVKANYMGPGTRLDVRIPRGDSGLSAVDKISKAHDLRYALARTEGDTRKADQKMLSVVKKVSDGGLDRQFNIDQANLIKLKAKSGIPTKWITTFGDTPDKLKGIFRRELGKLAAKGY